MVNYIVAMADGLGFLGYKGKVFFNFETVVLHKINYFALRQLKLRYLFFSFLKKKIFNFFVGVNYGFFFELRLIGMGYKCVIRPGNWLFLDLGFSHILRFKLPPTIRLFYKRRYIVLFGITLYELKQIASIITSLKQLNNYKLAGLVSQVYTKKLKIGKKR